MSDNKTKPTEHSVSGFLAQIADPKRRADADRLVALMSSAAEAPATLWGPAIVGFGSYHYRYESGREGDSPIVAFSPRKDEFSLYLNGIHSDTVAEQSIALLARLGKHRQGKGCLYVKRLADIDEAALSELIALSLRVMAPQRTR